MLSHTELWDLLTEIRSIKPLVHHITNWVTIYDCAQITRATGALPVMAHAIEEVEEMVSLASSLVINIGTLTSDFIDSAILALRRATEKNIPVVLDAVGAGATSFRTNSAMKILENGKISVLKGNAGEIATLAGLEAEVRGVESINVKGKPVEGAVKLARKYNNVVVITGKEDIVTDGENVVKVLNGHEMMNSVVGTGCMATSVIGSFVAVSGSPMKGSVYALSAFGIAGEIAAEVSSGPIEFKHRMMDSMAKLTVKDCEKMRVKEWM